MPKTMEQLTAAPTGKVLQECKNLIINFKQNGRDMGTGGEEFLSYMKDINLRRQKYEVEQAKLISEYIKRAKKCPKCGNAMKCYPVNTKPGNQVGGNWKSQWRCIPCDFNDFSLNDYKVELKNHGVG